MYSQIKLEQVGRVALLTLNRPEQSNAFSAESYAEMIAAMERCDADDSVGAVVITGAGKNFSAGGDVQRFQRLIDEKTFLKERNVLETGRMSAAIRRCGKPVVAMVNGAAAGAGFSVALACDFRIVTPGSRFVCSFIKMALPGDSGALMSLVTMLGSAKAMELMMLGEAVGGEKAADMGLATLLVPEQELAERTMAFAQKLANGPGVAYRCQKKLLYESFFRQVEPYTDRESHYMQLCSHTDDFAQAVSAFLEKRPPVFAGK